MADWEQHRLNLNCGSEKSEMARRSRAPNTGYYAATCHYFGWRIGADTAASAGTSAAGVSVPGIKLLERSARCSACFTTYEEEISRACAAVDTIVRDSV